MAPFLYASPHTVRDWIPATTRSLGLFAHHGTDTRLCANLVEYVRSLAANHELFLLLTNERPLDNVADLPANCRVVFVPNQGLDIGKHMCVLHNAHHVTRLERLGLYNDSAFLVQSLQPFFDGAKTAGWEVWGMTQSAEMEPHIQSYFVVADSPRAADRLLHFFTSRTMDHAVDPAYTKADLVKEFELGLSKHMAAACELHAWFSVDDALHLVSPRGVPNVSAFYWDALLRLGCPLLKKYRFDLGDAGTSALAAIAPEYAATIRDVHARVFTHV